MKKHFFFLLLLCAFTTAIGAQSKPVQEVNKQPHLTFLLQGEQFYYTQGGSKEKLKLEVVDSSSIAKIIDAAITHYKVKSKDLDVKLEGDDLMQHPKFELLLDTILSKTVSEVRLRTNLYK